MVLNDDGIDADLLTPRYAAPYKTAQTRYLKQYENGSLEPAPFIL